MFSPFVFFVLFLSSFANGNGNCAYNDTAENPQLGVISDCKCTYQTVHEAVNSFFAPLLLDITSRPFFRYFWVDLDKNCPFWDEEGKCFMEACSVCTCDEKEIPFLLKPPEESEKTPDQLVDFGWIASHSTESGEVKNLEGIDFQSSPTLPANGKTQNEWIDMAELKANSNGVFVNLLQNPERFTGYSGPSAQRVWKSIQQENCFGGINDICTEKRLFYRLMSGLQASISTHIAREYYHPDGHWGHNNELFERAVGSYIDRVNNLYFSFLFLLRAVVKAKDALAAFPLDSGNVTEDTQVKELLNLIASAKIDQSTLGLKEWKEPVASVGSNPQSLTIAPSSINFLKSDSLESCRNGFDESVLFSISPTSSMDSYQAWETVNEKELMKEEFRLRFRNISRIMDCVTCEKCRLWGKLQILGFGTAIKVLMTSEQELAQNSNYLNRQEIVALINTLHQFSKSVEFASNRLFQKAPAATATTATKLFASVSATSVTALLITSFLVVIVFVFFL